MAHKMEGGGGGRRKKLRILRKIGEMELEKKIQVIKNACAFCIARFSNGFKNDFKSLVVNFTFMSKCSL